MPTPTAIDQARRFREQLAANEAASVERMGRIWQRLIVDLRKEVDALAEVIGGMEEVSRAKVWKLARTQQMLRQVEDQAARFGVTVQNETQLVIDSALQQGIDDALRLIEASLPPLPPELRGQLVGSFTRLPVDAVEAMAGITIDDGLLMGKITEGFGEAAAQHIADHLIDGVAKGMNPRRIAKLVVKNFDDVIAIPLTWAARTIRTAQIKSYQTANHAQYAANNDIVPKWVWVAALDTRTCMSCIAQHGTEHNYDETLNDHHNGRCAPVPKTISYADLGINLPDPVDPFEKGEDWFKRQPDNVQRQLMGAGKWEAWKGNKFTFGNLSEEYKDDVYGILQREKPLIRLVNDRP